MKARLPVGIGLIALAALILWAAMTLAVVAEDAETTSLTAKILAVWVILPMVAGVALVLWEMSER